MFKNLWHKLARKKSSQLFHSCEVLPLWNFFKIIEKADLKYLVRVKDRFEYESMALHNASDKHYQQCWDKILEEFAELENSTGMNAEKFTRTKLLIRYSQYLQEQAMIKLLFFETHPDVIKELRKRGYKMANTSQEAYWDSLTAASKRVHYHVTFIESMQIKLRGDKEDKKKEQHGSVFDQVMSWVASHDIYVDENITVSRYVEIKKIINNRIKALESQQKKHGRVK